MELAAALNNKNYSVFGRFFLENFPLLVMYADKYLGNMELAADVAQEAFIQLWHFDGEFESTEKVKFFLYTTARNLALNQLKHLRIVEEHIKFQEKEGEVFFRNQVIEEETYQLVHKAVNQLAEQSRKIILLSLQGYSN